MEITILCLLNLDRLQLQQLINVRVVPGLTFKEQLSAVQTRSVRQTSTIFLFEVGSIFVLIQALQSKASPGPDALISIWLY